MSSSGVKSSWAFRAALILLNILGLWWIHHDLTGGPRLGLRVLAALPNRDVDSADRLTLVFDRPLPLPGSPGAALAAAPFAIAPQVPGRWFWAAADRLEYRLDHPLPPGRRFTVRAAPALEEMTGRPLLGTSEFRYETRPLQLIACDVAGFDRDDVRIALTFNQPVDPTALLHRLKLLEPGKAQRLDARAESGKPAEKLTVKARRPRSGRLVITIDRALTGEGGELTLASEVHRELEVRASFALLGAEACKGGLERDNIVRIRFSKPLDNPAGGALPRVAVSPAVERLQTRVEDDVVVLRGGFESGRQYTATFEPSLKSADRDVLGTEATATFDIPERRPAVAFKNGSGILSPRGNLLVDLRTVNLSSISVQAARVHPNNIVHHLHPQGGGRHQTSRDLPAKTLRVEHAPNVPAEVGLDLRQLLGEPLGIYHLEVTGNDGAWVDESTVVAITDMAITSKAERSGLCVWVTSLRTAEPVAGAEVTAFSYNGQVLDTARTNAGGIARLATPADHPDGTPWVITATAGNDMTFLRPDEHGWDLDGSEIGVDFEGRPIPLTYDVMLYTERGVYRPGETIHVTGIIRDAAGRVPPPFPLTVTVQRPDGRDVARLSAASEAGRQGFFHVDYTPPETAQTGGYEFRATLPGSKDVLGSVQSLVEEYVPLRLQVNARALKPRFGAGEKLGIEVTSRYLFDQPCAELPVRVTGSCRRQPFVSKQFGGFEFDPPSSRHHDLSVPEEKLDAQGRATILIDPPPTDEPGCWQVDLTATVSEQGGRSVSDRVQAVLDSTSRHVGVRLPAGRIVKAGSPVRVEWIQLTGDDAVAEAAAASCSLTRIEYDTALQQIDGRYVWTTVERAIPVSDLELPAPTDRPGSFELSCPAPGLHRLRITDCRSGIVGQLEFQAVDDEDQSYLAGLNRPERVLIALDRPSYTPGSTARLVVKSPFAGTMLLTVETDRVIDARVIPLCRSSLELELPVDEGIRGGAFVTATVVRPIDPEQTSWLPHRAMGAARLNTDHVRHDLPVSIAAVPQARPAGGLTVRVQTPSPSDPANPPVVHLWAVDEGILLATAYATPRPADYFFAPREAGVGSADAFGDLLPDVRRPESMARIGGDGDEGYNRRLTSVPAPRRSPAVIWRASLPVGADGTLTADLSLPDLTGRLRLMAVAADRDLYGSAEQMVTLTAPLLVEVACPRFVAPGDRFDLPTKVFNSSPEPLTATLEYEVHGPLRVETPGSPELRIEAGRSATLWARATATGLGPVRMVTRAKAAPARGEPLAATRESSFAVRPAGPLHSESKLVRIKVGEPFRTEPSADWVPGSARTTVCLSATPAVHLQPAVEQLLDYPYGCVEQTSSRMYVLLSASDLLRPQAGPDARTRAIGELFDSGIARLRSMQTPAGGFSYWPGESEPCLWATAYAAELLVRAERADHKLEPAVMEELARYLQAELNNASNEDCDANTRAHICHVLAAMRRGPQSWISRLSEMTGQLDMAGRAHLAAAWMELGRRDRATAVLADDTITQEVATSAGTSIVSMVQEEGVLLNVLLDLDPHHPWIPALVQRLEKARRNGQWGSTLENACALSALMRYQRSESAPPVFQGTIRQGGWSASFDQSAPRTFARTSDQPIEIDSKGTGELYLAVTTEGLVAGDQAKEYDRQLRVARRWLDRQGKPVDSAAIRVGDLVQVETTLAVKGKGVTVDNIAIVDALPGGMEIENPRLATSEAEGNEPSADHVEFRDDRVLVFSSAGGGKRVFRYALRAVSAGSFAVPPIQASCMYDASFASVRGGGRVEIAR